MVGLQKPLTMLWMYFFATPKMDCSTRPWKSHETLISGIWSHSEIMILTPWLIIGAWSDTEKDTLFQEVTEISSASYPLLALYWRPNWTKAGCPIPMRIWISSYCPTFLGAPFPCHQQLLPRVLIIQALRIIPQRTSTCQESAPWLSSYQKPKEKGLCRRKQFFSLLVLPKMLLKWYLTPVWMFPVFLKIIIQWDIMEPLFPSSDTPNTIPEDLSAPMLLS